MGYIGKSECQQCGREVDVSENVSGRLYYRCGPCGFKAQQTSARGDRMLREKTRLFADQDEAPPEPKIDEPKRSDSPRNAEAKPAHVPAKPAPEPAKQSGAMAAFWGRK
ncbi:hypothetical protein [Burkholderia pseudomallei]|uniref:hypothetical protein n=1 Tax=Burkholderia pseudomallei TaxID=28450 RepID=UPI0005D80090|nr:hypothetical protein [Burkholderia pseudomallei]AJW53201.1 hypothetical protein UQ47_09105 [Burkholderia pseudomallei]